MLGLGFIQLIASVLAAAHHDLVQVHKQIGAHIGGRGAPHKSEQGAGVKVGYGI